MTKRKSVVSKILLLLIVLTLISCCFLGSTFARYVSNGSGKASMSVAKWSISDGDEGVAVTFDKLSPSMKEYEGTARTNTTGLKLVATISNTGDVDANVTLKADKSTYVDGVSPHFLADASGEALTYGNGIGGPDKVPTQVEAEEVFSIKLYYSTTEQAAPTTDNTTAYNLTADTPVTIPVAKTNGVVYIYAEVIWTSDTNTMSGVNADARDTWLGENVTTVNYVVSYTAVQNSKLPE